MIPVLMLFVLILSSTANAADPLEQLAGAFTSVNGLVTSILGLINSIVSLISNFSKKPQLSSLFTTFAAVNNSSSEIQNCVQVEQNNFFNLLNSTSNTIEQCINTYGNNAETAIQTTFNLIANLGEIVYNVTELAAGCLQSESTLLEIPVCFLSQIADIPKTFIQIVNELTTEIQTTVGILGSLITNTSSCLVNIIREFVMSFFILISTFTSCLTQL